MRAAVVTLATVLVYDAVRAEEGETREGSVWKSDNLGLELLWRELKQAPRRRKRRLMSSDPNSHRSHEGTR